MKRFLLITVLTVTAGFVFAQCPFNVVLNSSGNCLGDTLYVTTANALSQIVWYNGSTLLQTVTGTNTGVTVAGGNGAGTAANQFIGPTSVYLDGSGNIYVTDRGNNRVQEWTAGATSGITVAGGNGIGPNPNQLYYPCATVVDGSGNLYVSDQNNRRVQKWAPGAAAGLTVAGGNGYGIAANQFMQPWGLFLDAGGNLYVVDQGANRVQKFPPGSSSATDGVTVAGGASGVGAPAAQLVNPIGVYVDGSGNVYITDNGNSRVQKWAPGAASGTTVAGGNGPGSNANQLNGITGIFVDGGGNIYVADQNNNRIQKWAPGATTGITVAGGFGYGSGSSPGQLSAPAGVFLDGQGNIYIADYGNDRIQKWTQKPIVDTTYIATAAGVYTAVVTNNDGCTVTTNAVTINPTAKPSFSISASASAICTGDSVIFTAMPLNAGTSPSYQWQINNNNTGNNQPSYMNASLENGDIINCILTANTACSSPVSSGNTITITVGARPVITMGPDQAIFQGGSVQLSPVVSGNVSSYLWSPVTGLDNAAIINPTARPSVTTTYTLTVGSANACMASGNITVKVLAGIIVPNAFSPNGDGVNDTWNINSLSFDYPGCTVDVFNRYGQQVFHSEGYGKPWDGTYNKSPLPVGTYYYIINLKSGTPQMSGSVTIVR